MKSKLVALEPSKPEPKFTVGSLVKFSDKHHTPTFVVLITKSVSQLGLFEGMVVYTENANRPLGQVETSFYPTAFEHFDGAIQLTN